MSSLYDEALATWREEARAEAEDECPGCGADNLDEEGERAEAFPWCCAACRTADLARPSSPSTDPDDLPW